MVAPVEIVECAPGAFSIFGEIDRDTAHELDELDDVHGQLLLDLHGVTFLDSSGAAALVRLYQRCPRHDCTLQLRRCSPQVERVLRILKLYELLTAPEAGRSANGDGEHSDMQPPASRDGVGGCGDRLRRLVPDDPSVDSAPFRLGGRLGTSPA